MGTQDNPDTDSSGFASSPCMMHEFDDIELVPDVLIAPVVAFDSECYTGVRPDSASTEI